ncbi:MAG: C40 family peptidase [Ruminococcus sp.]|nr:C40 family peptidase [Ruminococcus sp.]
MNFMKKQILTGLSTAALTLALVSGIVNTAGFDGGEDSAPSIETAGITVMSANAAYSYKTPEVKTQAVYSDIFKFVITNYADYGKEAKIVAYVGGKKVSTTTAAALKKASGKLNITNDGTKNLKPNTKYAIKIVAVYDNGKKMTKSFNKTTAIDSYWTVHKGVNVFERSGGKFVKSFTADSELVYRGELVDKKCKVITGKAKTTAARYLKVKIPFETGVNELGEMQYVYKDCYIDYKLNKKVNRKSPSAVRNVVVNYAKMMTELPNQRYELSGEYVGKDSTVSDCSGMTELAYLQIGYYLEHYADRQANNYGKVIYNNLKSTGVYSGVETYALKNSSSRVDISKLVKGDLVFFMEATNNADDNSLYVDNGIGHVGMYLGGGKMAHFTAGYGIYNHPCRIEDLAQYDKGLRVVKAVRYVI